VSFYHTTNGSFQVFIHFCLYYAYMNIGVETLYA
jgi:hypothetical protein